MPLAALLAGWLGAQLGVRETIAAMACLFAVTSAGRRSSGPTAGAAELPGQPMATWSSGSTATARKTTVT